MRVVRGIKAPQIWHSYYQIAVEKLGFRAKAYKQTFAPGAPGHAALADLARFCGAFYDAPTGNLTNEQLREIHGRRQAFFRIWKHLNLDPAQLEAVYQTAVQETARTLYLAEHGE